MATPNPTMAPERAAVLRVVLPQHDGVEQTSKHNQTNVLTTIPIVIEVIITLQQDGRIKGDGDASALPRLPTTLTRRELEVLGLVAQHYSNRMIAEALVIAESTVKQHVKRIFEKLAVSNRYEAAAYARGPKRAA